MRLSSKAKKPTQRSGPCGVPARVWRYNQFRMDADNRIVIDPKICHGKPIIRGTRLPVAIVLGSLAGGMNFDEVQREYSISIDDIRAAIGYANALVEREQHHPLPA